MKSKQDIRKYYKHKNCLHEGWVKHLKIKSEKIDFDKSYVEVRRESGNEIIDPNNPITWLRIQYKKFFHCKCPNLRGDGTNHSLENCRHYQRSQYKKLQNGKLLNKNEKNYDIKYRRFKKLYKPFDYDIYFYVKVPRQVRNHQAGFKRCKE